MIGRIQVRLVAMGAADSRAQVVRDHELGTTAVELEGSYVRGRPVRQGLRPGGLGEGVARGAEHGHEDLRLTLLAGLGVDHRHRLPGVVDEQLLAGAVLLAHHQVELSSPFPVLLAEPAELHARPINACVYWGFLILPGESDAILSHTIRPRPASARRGNIRTVDHVGINRWLANALGVVNALVALGIMFVGAVVGGGIVTRYIDSVIGVIIGCVLGAAVGIVVAVLVCGLVAVLIDIRNGLRT